MRSDEEKIVRIHFAALIKPEAADTYSGMINLSSATQDVSRVRPSRSPGRPHATHTLRLVVELLIEHTAPAVVWQPTALYYCFTSDRCAAAAAADSISARHYLCLHARTALHQKLTFDCWKCLYQCQVCRNMAIPETLFSAIRREISVKSVNCFFSVGVFFFWSARNRLHKNQ